MTDKRTGDHIKTDMNKADNVDYTPKKASIILILDILKQYSDENHRLQQKDIVDILRQRYDMNVGRKAVKQNLDVLDQLGYQIIGEEKTRMVRDRETGELEESEILSDIYLEKDFTDSELRLIIDSLLFSKHIPYKQRLDLAEKLSALSSTYFKSHVKHITTVPNTLPVNPQLFLTVDILDEAINKQKKVSFNYIEYGTDKQRHPKLDKFKKIRKYTVSPYQMAAKDDKYYLICNNDWFDNLSNYRVDRIENIQILDTPAKPFEELAGVKGNRFDLAEYMMEHIYMFAGKTVKAKFSVVKAMVGDVIDMFGTDVRFSDETESRVTVTAKVNEDAMIQFAKSYGPDVLILEPQPLVEQMREKARQMWEAYKD